MPVEFTEFELLIIRARNEVGPSVLLLLAWIACSDEDISSRERARLDKIATKSGYAHEISNLISLAETHDTAALQLAAEILSSHFSGQPARLFLELAIGMAIADHYLRPEENHILRFLADVLGLSAAELEEAFRNVTGKPLPDPPDLSDPSWWARRDRANSSKRNSREHSKKPHARLNQRVKALAMLGLGEEATREEIVSAYRRLAQVHHPDRFSTLGEESVAAATVTFQRIKAAYEYLTIHA